MKHEWNEMEWNINEMEWNGNCRGTAHVNLVQLAMREREGTYL